MPLTSIRAQKAVLAQWMLLGGALLVMGAALVVSLYRDRARTLEEAADRLMTQAVIVEQIVSTNLESLNLVLVKLAAERVDRLPPAVANARLKALEEGMPGVRTLAALNARGAIVACSRPEILGGDYTARDYFVATKASADRDVLSLGRPFVSVLGVRTINVSRAILGPEGGFQGLVSATLDPDYFSPFLGSVLYAPDMWGHLVHYDGEVFLDMPRREGVAGMNLAMPGTLFSRHRQSGKPANVYLDTVWATGQKRMLAARTIVPSGLSLDRPLVVGLARDPEAVLERWRTDALLQGALFLTLVAISVPGLALYQRRQRQFDLQAAQAAQALRENERFMRAVADNIPGMVGYWDADLRCRFANAAYQEWFGKAPEQMPGITIQELLGPALFAKNEPYIRAALAGQVQRFERILTRADGTVGHTQAHYIPDQDQDRVRGFFVLVSDVTELKRAQNELEARVAERTEELRRAVDELSAAKVQAEAASRAKSAFLANLSHELRTPLNPILALTDLVLAGELQDEQREYLGDVLGASKRLLAMFERLFDLVELEDYAPESSAVALAGLRSALLEQCSSRAREKGLELGGSLGPGLPACAWLDLRLVRLAAGELCDNALRFTASGGVEVNLALAPEEERKGQRLVLEVADTGPGIAQESLAAIRTGLTQGEAPLTKRHGGLGVGMAIVGRAVELMGGELVIDSAPGSGTRMRLVLPLCPAPEEIALRTGFVCSQGG